MRFQIIVHNSIFFYLILKMVALNNSRPWVTLDDRFSMPLLEIAVQNQERRHCRSKTRFIGLQHVTESTLHNQSWAAKNRSLITNSAQNSFNSSLIAEKFDCCGLKNRGASCAQDFLAQSALRRGAWWFVLASRHCDVSRDCACGWARACRDACDSQSRTLMTCVRCLFRVRCCRPRAGTVCCR